MFTARARALASLALLLALATALAGCGSGGSSGAQALLSETFQSHKPIESGRIALALALAPSAAQGTVAGPQLLAVGLSGPFQGHGPGRLPEFALQLRLRAGGHTLRAGATSTGGQIYIELAGTQFVAPAGTAAQLQQSYAQSTRASSKAAASSTFAQLGVDPGEWVENPEIVQSNALVTHITGDLNTSKFLADVQKVSGAGGALGLGGAGSALPASGSIGELEKSVSTARVDVYTGTHDHLLRRLTLSARIAATPQARSALGISGAATLTLDLRFAQLNQRQTIAAPAHARAISELGPALAQLGGSLALGSGG